MKATMFGTQSLLSINLLYPPSQYQYKVAARVPKTFTGDRSQFKWQPALDLFSNVGAEQLKRNPTLRLPLSMPLNVLKAHLSDFRSWNSDLAQAINNVSPFKSNFLDVTPPKVSATQRVKVICKG